ncbi:MAG: hypothetical protein IJ493_05170 [Clostridia bacterium]|nr:hypothetical protein [Clostridia bacterium]
MKHTKLCAGVMVFAMTVTTLLLSSCGEQKPTAEKAVGVFAGEKIELAENFSGDALARDGGTLYILGSMDGEEGSQPTMAVIDETGTVDYETLDMDITPRSFALLDGGYLFLSRTFDRKTGSQIYSLHYYKDGLVWSKDTSDYLEIPENYYRELGAAVFGDTIVIAAYQSAVLLSVEGKVTAQVTLPGYLNALAASGERAFIDCGETLYELGANGSMTEMEGSLSESSTYSAGEGYDLCYTNDSGVWGMTWGEEGVSSSEIMNWVNSNILSNRISSFCVMSAEEIYFWGSDGLDGETGLWRYTKVPEDQVPERLTVRIAYIETGRYLIPKAAILFNKSQSQYQVVCEELMAADGDYENAQTRLDAGIVAGTIGDIVAMDCYDDQTAYRKYAEKGAFADLYTLFNEEWAKEDFFGCVLDWLDVDGSLYALPQEFSLVTLISAPGTVDGEWNASAFMALADSGKRLFNRTTRAVVENQLSDSILAECVNLEDGTCDFTSGSFVKYLEFIQSLPETDEDGFGWGENHYATGEVLLCNHDIMNVGGYMQMNYIFGNDVGPDVLGYPTANGGAVKISATTLYGITSGSLVKDGAMTFLRYLLSQGSIIDTSRGMRYIPVCKDTLQAWFESEGNLYYRFYLDDTGSYGTSSTPYELKEGEAMAYVDQAALDGMFAFLDGLTAMPWMPADICNIVDEEMTAYLAGTQDAGKTAELIENRVGLYLAEQQ